MIYTNVCLDGDAICSLWCRSIFTRARHKLLVLGATALSCFAIPSVVYAIDPYQLRPFWNDKPPTGLFYECAGQVITKNGWGILPARTVYTEIEASIGGTCNTLLDRPAGWIYNRVIVYRSSGLQCSDSAGVNPASQATLALTGPACSTTVGSVVGVSVYQHPDVPGIYWQATSN